MKFRITPSLICAVVLFFLGIYYTFFSESNLAPPVGFVIILFGGVCLLFNWFFLSLFKNSLLKQILTELIVILVIYTAIYKLNGKVILQPTHNYQGYLYVVYDVAGKPELKLKSVFYHNIDVPMPANGIVLTSSAYPDGFMNHLAVADTSAGKPIILLPGYGIVNATDTIKCGNKKYLAQVFFKGSTPPTWRYMKDTVNRNLKKQEICRLIDN